MDYDDYGLAAMPKLVGGDNSRRLPAVAVKQVDRPPDPDDLPIQAAWTDEDQALAQELGLASVAAGAGTATSTAAPKAAPPPAEARSASQPHPNGTWPTGEGAAPATPSRRGFGSLFRGRKG